MKKKLFNSTHIEGYLYEQKLETRISGPGAKEPGTEYIAGTISIATDEALTNIVDVRFGYVTATNKNWALLTNISKGVNGTVMAVGKENATKLRIDASFSLNEYVDKNNPDNIISQRINDGTFSFIHVTNNLKPEAERSRFDVDILINNVRRLEPTEDEPDLVKAIVKGGIFSYRKDYLPMEFIVCSAPAIDYFESLEASKNHPVFTHVRGSQISEVVKKTITQESAFGGPEVREVTNSRRACEITWATPDTYVFDDESTILASELKEILANRELTVAKIKKDYEEKNKNQASAFQAKPAVATNMPNLTTPGGDDFNF